MRDQAQVELLRYQANSPNYDLEFTDNSLQNPVGYGSWKIPVGMRIEQSDAMIVMIGKDTHGRPAVSWEIRHAQMLNIPIIPVKISSDKRITLPKPLKGKVAVKWKLREIQLKLDNYSS